MRGAQSQSHACPEGNSKTYLTLLTVFFSVGSSEQHTVTLDTSHSAVDSQQTGKRKRKRSSNKNVNSRTLAKTSSRAGDKQRSTIRKEKRKKLK